ncbi:MAG: twitching motility protein PilT, partial [Acidobacteria bacterium]|nr:twitching motility protein PilT [Acidobacteriota bacterium]
MTVPTPTATSAEQPAFTLNDLLVYMGKQEASDLHLKPMRPPLIRVRGKLIAIPNVPPLKPPDLEKLLLPILNQAQRDKFDANQSVDFGYGVPGVARFRANLYMQRGTVGAVFRRIPIQIQNIDSLDLPMAIKELTQIPDGLVLVTGPTGSGKSTTLAAMISFISEHEPLHIVTIEDPIEFLFTDKMAAISQREVGTDTPSFREALRNAMRLDPDVLMVGVMREMETIC